MRVAQRLKTNMALGASVKRHFPMRKVDDVVEFFRAQLESDNEPDLALLSIVTGYIENLLTFHRNVGVEPPASEAAKQQQCFPVVECGPIEALHAKFACQIKGSLDLSALDTDTVAGTRDLIKRVSDVIWSSLTRSYYKDRPHLQSLYSYLTGNKLDCFGVAFAVVAACQTLGFPDIHLALSEDHAWVTYGDDSEETAEVTWHGKGNEDRRGQPIPQDKSWLYLNGHAIQCTRATEVAALVSAINPTISPTTDSTELVSLQQQLLWLLYDKGHLRNYPMALGNLGELEGLFPTPGRPPPQDLFAEAVHASRTYYHNHHVYPYTYLGGFLFRSGRLKEALRAWADAADVIRKFNYGREDEEIYKEFMEIANELVPQLVKLSSSGDGSLLQDPGCFAHLLRFYDGLCAWEEGSATPVLHIGWARPLVGTIAKFPATVRAAASVHASTGEEEEEAAESKNHKDAPPSVSKEDSKKSSEASSQDSTMVDGKEPKEEDFLKSLENQLGQSNGPPHPDIVALAAACAENILNPDYLLGCGEPFSTKNGNNVLSTLKASESDFMVGDLFDPKVNGHTSPDELIRAVQQEANNNSYSFDDDDLDLDGEKAVVPTAKPEKSDRRSSSDSGAAAVTLSSQKMAGLKELLLSEKLNTSAIQLQLTAQSQVQVVKRGNPAGPHEPTTRHSKRTRRE
ncbi:menin 1 isoform X1 [Haemaphysalis longicornis]